MKEKMKKDLKNHMRDRHLNISSSTSAPPKKKRTSVVDDGTEDMEIDTEEIILKIDELSIKEQQKTEEKVEMKRRSDLMDEKVKAIEKRREEEERKYFERLQVAEQVRLEKEEKENAKLRGALAKKNNAEKKRKVALKKEEFLKQRGITKLPAKFNCLVGEYNNVLNIPGDGTCQSSSKAAILFQDSSRGPQLAIEENSYIVEHWEEFFVFPHTLKIGGGKTKVCNTDIEFLQFLVLNPDVSFIWADHHQLQVTCNLYNTIIQVLTIDANGEGSILNEPIRPNPNMASYSLIPATKPNGEKVDVPEVWLRYTNNNHYDALLKDDHPLITQGSLKEKEFIEETNESKQNNINYRKKCDDCKFYFTSTRALEKHQEETGHIDGFWEVMPEKETKAANPVHNEIQNSNIIDELLDFELTYNSDTENNSLNLIKERKEHNETKKSLKALQVEFNKCKAELGLVMEEKI